MADDAKKPAKPADADKKTAPAKSPTVDAGPKGVLQSPDAKARKKRRRSGILTSFFIVFLVPAILGVWYYAMVASDRYAAGASFVVRGLDSSGPGDLVSSFTGLASTGSTTSDSYVIRRFLESPDLVQDLDAELNLRAHYSDSSVDWLSRFDNDQSFEDFVDYWKWRITTTYDSSTGIVTFEAQAFDAQMAKRLADSILNRTAELVNELSEQARRDSVQFAATEVERAEERLRQAQLAIREFRSSRGSIDPALNSQLDAQLIASLESQLADVRARIAALAEEVNEEAPMMRQLRFQETALLDQIQLRREAVGSTGTNADGASTADALAEFEALQIEQTFAQQRYASALSSLENARMDADRQQRYLAIFSRPFFPEQAIYPERVRNAFLSIAACFVFWAIATLVTLAVRDHLR